MFSAMVVMKISWTILYDNEYGEYHILIVIDQLKSLVGAKSSWRTGQKLDVKSDFIQIKIKLLIIWYFINKRKWL